jgi:hypothetical protein
VSEVGLSGPPAAVLNVALAGRFEIVTSQPCSMNYAACSPTPSCRRIGDADELIKFLALAAIAVTPTETVELVRDPDDDRLTSKPSEMAPDPRRPGPQQLCAGVPLIPRPRVVTASQCWITQERANPS